MKITLKWHANAHSGSSDRDLPELPAVGHSMIPRVGDVLSFVDYQEIENDVVLEVVRVRHFLLPQSDDSEVAAELVVRVSADSPRL